MLSIRNISKSFHHRKILKDISIELQSGERVALVGANGAGKTTLLKILAGISRPERGRGTLLGEKMFTDSIDYLNNLIFWGHQSMFYPAFTGIENLRLFFDLRNDTPPESIFEDQLKLYGFDSHRNKPVRNYSTGMLQRLSMIKLTMSTWQLALMDEPTSGLDAAGLTILKQLLEVWSNSQRSILFVTHEADWAAEFADRVLLINNGVIAKDVSKPSFETIRNLMDGDS